MAETVFDQYKEMVEKTKQLHSELVELSSKVGNIVETIDSGMPGSITLAKKASMRDSDVNVVNSFESYYLRDASLKGQGSNVKD